MKRIAATFVTVFTVVFILLSYGHAQEHDLVINNGRVMAPETLYDDVANVGVTNGRIVEISQQPLTGSEKIDVTGMPDVAPGIPAKGEN